MILPVSFEERCVVFKLLGGETILTYIEEYLGQGPKEALILIIAEKKEAQNSMKELFILLSCTSRLITNDNNDCCGTCSADPGCYIKDENEKWKMKYKA